MNYEVVKGILPSPSEKLIAKKLKERGIPFEQEVVFEGCRNFETGCSLRFDFYLPSIKTVIEYDGISFHEDVEVRRRDQIKNKFAKDNGLRLIRIQGFSNIDKLFNDEMHIKLPTYIVDEKPTQKTPNKPIPQKTRLKVKGPKNKKGDKRIDLTNIDYAITLLNRMRIEDFDQFRRQLRVIGYKDTKAHETICQAVATKKLMKEAKARHLAARRASKNPQTP